MTGRTAMATFWTALRLTILIGILLFMSYNGVAGGVNAIGSAFTLGQQVATGVQLLYGGLAVGTLIALALKHRSAWRLFVAWCTTATVVAALAPVVWGDTPVVTGVLAGLTSAAIMALLVWMWRLQFGPTHPLPPDNAAGSISNHSQPGTP